MLSGVCPACGLRPLSEGCQQAPGTGTHGVTGAAVPCTRVGPAWWAGVRASSFPSHCPQAGGLYSPPCCAPAPHEAGKGNSPSRASTHWAPCSSQTAVSIRDKVLSPCLSCLGSNCFVSASSSLCCPSLRWRSGYVYTYSTKIKRHKYTQNAADSEQLKKVPDAGKTRMLEGWNGSSGYDGLCCLWSLLPEVTLLLCLLFQALQPCPEEPCTGMHGVLTAWLLTKGKVVN